MKIKGITNLEYLTNGHRGVIYTGLYKGKKVAIKAKLPESRAIDRIENEGNWLKRLNKKGIGPKLIKAEKDYFFYYFVDGKFMTDYFRELDKNDKSKKIILKILKDVLEQCYVLDGMNVDKEEMHHPIKHILITKRKKVVLLDFERCHVVDYGKNVTQFVVFLMKLHELLEEYEINLSMDKLIALSKVYKRDQSKKNFEKILDELQ